MWLRSASTFHSQAEEANFKSKLAIASDSVTVASFGVKLPIVEGDDDYARS
jgi:hypothetical protein